MKTFYQLAEAIKTQSRGLPEPRKNATIQTILKGLPHREIVLFALHCAEDCRQFDNENSSELVKACNQAAQDCINQVRLWLKNNKTDCSQAAAAARDAADACRAANDAAWAANDAAWAATAALVANYAANAADAVNAAAHYADTAASGVAWAARWAAHAAAYAADIAASDAKIAEYIELAKDMRANVRTFDLPKYVIELAKTFVATGNIDRADLGALADHLMENDSELIKEKEGKFVFTLLPSITGDSHEEVYNKIAKSSLAKQLIVQTVNNS